MASANKDILLARLRGGSPMGTADQFKLTLLLALPAILAQLSMCLMSYIDAAMVGRLGSAPAAAVGLVSTSTWILGGFCYANNSGFSVQIAHRCGARDFAGARKIFHRGLLSVSALSIVLALAGLAVSGALPGWLGGSADINSDASDYFRVYSLFLPVFQIAIFCEASLIASGNMKIPSITSMAMCLLDMLFNYIFIFVLGLGVKGAAIGTGLATLCAGAFLLIYVFTRSEELKQKGLDCGSTKEEAGQIYGRAFNISWPLWLQNLVTRGAYVAATVIVAPLGTVAIAANSFAVIAEGFCYLPGYGMQDAATTLVGQSLGARRKDMARSFAKVTIATGASMMTLLAVLMWAFAPQIMMLMSQDPEVIALGASCLRIEAWAELLFGVSIVAYGCCVGAGDTLVPSAINLLSMWVVRLGLALILIPHLGLEGYWIAMATELSLKGIIFAFRIRGDRWMKTRLTESVQAPQVPEEQLI